MDIQPQSSAQRIASSIDDVTDSQGEPVPHNSTTEDTLLTLSGRGTAGSLVFIFDDGVFLTTASVITPGGTWRYIETLTLGRHAFTVRDSLGGVDSPEWVVTVGEAVVKPEITLVTDSNGEIEPDGNTFDTSVTLTGTAKANETVELFQDGTSQGDVLVNASGVWTRPVTGLTVRNHNFQVRARYGNNPVSGVRSLTVLASEAPTISNIQDAAGVEIPPSTTTYSTSVTLTGTAAAGEQVRILDGTTVLGTVTATGVNWTLALSSLAVKAYSIKVVGLYGSNPESAVRGFTVAVATVPTIDRIQNAAGVEIPEGGDTTSMTVNLSGTASADQRVEIFDGATSRGTATATGRNWTLQITGLSLGLHRFTAKGLYGGEPVSAPERTVTVAGAFTLPSTPVPLSGTAYKARIWPTNDSWPTSGRDFAGNSAIRAASGGVRPYQYASSNPAIVSVNSEGKVVGERNGSATITVTDQEGSRASYVVSVQNVYIVHVNKNQMTYTEARAWWTSLLPTDAEFMSLPILQAMSVVYDWPPDLGNNEYWWSAIDMDSSRAYSATIIPPALAIVRPGTMRFPSMVRQRYANTELDV